MIAVESKYLNIEEKFQALMTVLFGETYLNRKYRTMMGLVCDRYYFRVSWGNKPEDEVSVHFDYPQKTKSHLKKDEFGMAMWLEGYHEYSLDFRMTLGSKKLFYLDDNYNIKQPDESLISLLTDEALAGTTYCDKVKSYSILMEFPPPRFNSAYSSTGRSVGVWIERTKLDVDISQQKPNPEWTVAMWKQVKGDGYEEASKKFLEQVRKLPILPESIGKPPSTEKQ